ncbi:DNA topoisomerase IV [Flavobacteriaceae bacterium]|nr:DNA topoisomerase IV [Flavobacteriaceae bacterium]
MRYFYYLLCSLLCCSCYNVERSCKDFKTGTFTFQQLVGTELVSSTFVRNDSIAIETYKGVTDTFSVRWINNCEYIMRKLNPKNTYDQQAVHFKILSTTENTYLFEFQMVVKKQNQENLVKKGTVTKVNIP